MQEQQPECPLDILCQSDPQYLFMQELVDQIDTYLSYIEYGMIINLVPLIYITHTILSKHNIIFNNTGTVQENTEQFKPQNGADSRNRRSVGSQLMPYNCDYHGVAETNAQVYMHEYFQQVDPINKYLKKDLSSRHKGHRSLESVKQFR